MQTVSSGLHYQFQCHVLKALFFITIALKLSYFRKKCKIFKRWGISPQTPCLRRRGAESRTWARGQLKHGWAPSRAQIWCDGHLKLDGPPVFVMSKTDGENAAVWSQIWCDFQKKKKGLHRNFDCFSGRNQVISKKKGFSPKFWLLGLPLQFRWPFYYSMQFGWPPSRANGPPEHHGPQGHSPPCPPPLRGPAPASGGFVPRPPIASGSWEIRLQTPKTTPSIANFWLRTWHLSTVNNYMTFRSFCFEQFFLHRSVTNFIMLTIDVCLIVFCLKSFTCVTHFIALIPSCYIALSYLFARE